MPRRGFAPAVARLEQHGRGDLMRYRRDVFDDKYARLRADRPCKTIVAHLAKGGNGYVYPTQVRALSFREGARVQSFHDSYLFCGSPSDQWIHLGNAVLSPNEALFELLFKESLALLSSKTVDLLTLRRFADRAQTSSSPARGASDALLERALALSVNWFVEMQSSQNSLTTG